MVNNVRPGYVNPLTMMKSGKDRPITSLCSNGIQKAEKRQRDLEAEKQSIQNSLLLMKGTSQNAGNSEETIKLLEKKLEEITKEMKIDRKNTAEDMALKPRLDTYESQSMSSRRLYNLLDLLGEDDEKSKYM